MRLLLFSVLLLVAATARSQEVLEEAEHRESFLTENDFLRALDDDTGTKAGTLSEEDFRNAEELAVPLNATHRRFLTRQTYYKGDIRGKASWRLKSRRLGARRNGVISGIKKWPNGRIPYVISSQYNERERAVLAKSFNEYHKRTCIRFVPRTAFDHDYLYIGKIDGCFSDVGKAGGRQELSLDDGCLQYDTAIHELMHSVGFYHEHERWDRDQFITILWHNIDREAYDQFGKVDLSESSYYGQTYDYHSVMHYDSLAFSKNGFETMVARRQEMTAVIGSAIDFSPVDLLKINKMYQCDSHLASVTNQITAAAAWPSSASTLPLATGSRGAGKSSKSGSNVSAPLAPAAQAPAPVLPQAVLPVANSAPQPLPEGPEECADRTNLCWRWLDRCRSFFFEKIMREFCALSCGYCTPTPAPPVAPPALPPIVARSETAPLYQRFGRRK